MGRKGFLASVLISLASFGVFKILDKQDTPVVTLSNGDIVGFVSRSREGREFFQFLGIPYGKAERFEVRMKKPNVALKIQNIIQSNITKFPFSRPNQRTNGKESKVRNSLETCVCMSTQLNETLKEKRTVCI